MPISLGLALDVDAPFPELSDRARTGEALGFETVYVPDHSRPWRHDPVPGGIWFDGWTVLSALASATSRARIGTLVSNPVLRPPDLLVREALAVDHQSSGRLKLGIGTGIAAFDHEATGTPYWPLGERLARFREYVAFVDTALRSGGAPFSATGQFFAGTLTGLPPPVQWPRPPITVAGASKGVRATAVARAECWNTHGAFGVAPDDLVDHLSALNADVSARCESAGRDPSGLRRSVLLLGPLSPWARPGRLPEVVEQMSAIGFEEIVAFWPWTDEDRVVFEQDAHQVATLAR
ncbi:MAG TPA: LLM class flavin-dependent oxidoreductase [Acidimicrobiales bacterium]|jgi:alkanesulfonate monooxygenase SsuD/methylene tetrahydromethanopterin reductase-like flavin-dependent oxidoreductase (luciferase family)|nr:LLM class flavin-dependent oxidoreductase [Acidimicrobiales bacterium]